MSSPAITDVSEKPAVEDPKSSNVLQENPNVQVEESNLAVDKKKKRGKIVQRNYILNDVAALQRKVRCETSRKQEFVMGKEAKNGSNIVVKMKTGFFEYVKAHFINELVNIDEILDIDNAEAAKANTENSGEAYVEFSMNIAFT